MADTTMTSDVFKFVALRPPVSIEKKSQETNFIADPRSIGETPTGRLIATFRDNDGTKISEQVKNFISSNNYTLDYPEGAGNLTLSRIHEFIVTIPKENFTTEKLVNG